MTDLKIFNGFGIVPSSNCEAAGLDFYAPNNTGLDKQDIILNAFSKTYKTDADTLREIADRLVYFCTANADNLETTEENICNNVLNILQLYLSLKTSAIPTSFTDEERISSFVDDYLIFDGNGTPGMCVWCNEAIFINSGIKVALDPDTAGVFLNKSGKGNEGWDIRAQVVDEDYSGYVHISMAFTREGFAKVYCGDKLTQMVILPIIHKKCVPVASEEEYDELMKNSKRGSNGFGSSDVKH